MTTRLYVSINLSFLHANSLSMGYKWNLRPIISLDWLLVSRVNGIFHSKWTVIVYTLSTGWIITTIWPSKLIYDSANQSMRWLVWGWDIHLVRKLRVDSQFGQKSSGGSGIWARLKQLRQGAAQKLWVLRCHIRILSLSALIAPPMVITLLFLPMWILTLLSAEEPSIFVLKMRMSPVSQKDRVGGK